MSHYLFEELSSVYLLLFLQAFATWINQLFQIKIICMVKFCIGLKPWTNTFEMG